MPEFPVATDAKYFWIDNKLHKRLPAKEGIKGPNAIRAWETKTQVSYFTPIDPGCCEEDDI